jgi:RND family efflux transporter MFP subunit
MAGLTERPPEPMKGGFNAGPTRCPGSALLDHEVRVSPDSTSTPPQAVAHDPRARARRPWLRWVVLAAVAAGVAALFVWEPGRSEPTAQKRPDSRPTPVSAVAVEQGSLTERATYPGELDADAAEVASGVSGRILAVNVRIGDRVEKGQELARIDAAELTRQRAEAVAAADAASAAEARARVQLEAARRELERGQKLFDDRTISGQELDTLRSDAGAAEAAVQAAVAQKAQARARIGVLDQNIGETRIRAPFAGTVAQRRYDPGTSVAAGTSVIRVVANKPLRVRFEVPEQDIGRFGADTAFVVRAPPTGSREIVGHVTGLGTEVDRARRVVRVEGVIDDPPESWLPGMYAEVVAAQQIIEQATIVPAVALVSRLQEGGAVQVGVFRPEGGEVTTARWVPVRVVAREGERVAVEAPLEQGAMVLVGGHADLAEGAPIAVSGESR